MKKLIMLAAAAMLACIAQAASVDWKVTLTGQGQTLEDNGAFVLAFAGSDYDAVVKLVTVTGSETMQANLAKYALSTAAEITSNSRDAAIAEGSLNPSPDSVFWMVFSDGSYDAKSAVTWTAATDVSAYIYEPGGYSPGKMPLSATSFANTGTIAGVPEPTSGLLLLVGGALLALRRKQK